MTMEYQWSVLFCARSKNISQVQGHSLKLWSHKLNNKYAKYYDRRPYAENFVRQAYTEACVVLGPLPVQKLGFRASVRAAVQTTAQSGPRAIFLQNQPQAVKLKNALAHLWAATIRNGHSLGKFRWSDMKSSYTHAASHRVASYHNETGIQDT